MSIKLNLITAVCDNMGIGKNNDLPWRLKSELKYFTRMTTTTKDPNKKNVVIMGRKTWDSIPPKFKPMANRINFIMSRSDLNLKDYKDVYSFKNLDEIYDKLNDNKFTNDIENIWVIGGSHIYKECMDSKFFYRLYITKIFKSFDCDTFFPSLPENIRKISDPDIPEEIQEENEIQYQYNVYENTQYEK